ncbi:MAG: deoxyguanosinetriphosphate triphosphohydrolase [Candidatus Aminicenantales bacterium]
MELSIREELERIEAQTLSPRACLSADSRGRERPENPHPLRTDFQRDRDRIIHSKSFRRLKHKTQVFLAPFGDHYRTRLTHTLEVSQIARTISRALRLNEDLTEAIALGHDIGHTPFGHAGEETLNSLLPGGFTHAEQSLRVVEKLEYEGKGLNLTFEVRDGISKHSKGRGGIVGGGKSRPFSLEGQVVRVSDIIAYVNHDTDDALRAGIIREKDIPSRVVKLLGKYPALRIDSMVEDVVRCTLENKLKELSLSDEILGVMEELRGFLYEKVYFGKESRKELEKTRKILVDLYHYLLEEPEEYIKPYPHGDSLEKRVVDFIAGMTDRYALALYEKLFFPSSWT